jgi:hypothetical protein
LKDAAGTLRPSPPTEIGLSDFGFQEAEPAAAGFGWRGGVAASRLRDDG